VSCAKCGVPTSEWLRYGNLEQVPLERSLANCRERSGLLEAYARETKDPAALAKEIGTGTDFTTAMAHVSNLVAELGDEVPIAPTELCEIWEPKSKKELERAAKAKQFLPQTSIDLSVDMDLSDDGAVGKEGSSSNNNRDKDDRKDNKEETHNLRWNSDIKVSELPTARVRHFVVFVCDGDDYRADLKMIRFFESRYGPVCVLYILIARWMLSGCT